MAEAGRRYTFAPLERRGVLLGLDGWQLLVLATGGLMALVASRTFAGPLAPLAAVVTLGSAAGAALWRPGGRTLAGWLVTGFGLGVRRAGGPVVDPAPQQGVARPRHRSVGPLGIDLLEVDDHLLDRPVGVIRDRRSGWWAAVLAVEGATFALLDPAEQVRRLEGWRAVLGTAARPGTPVRRLQWVQRTGTNPVEAPTGWPAGEVPPGVASARESYRDLLAGRGGIDVPRHDSWLLVAVSRRRRGAGGGAAGEVGSERELLQRELRLLHGQLRNADLRPGPVLDRSGLAGLLAAGHAVHGAGRFPWPMASDEAWSALRTDGAWHATYWVAEWPRLEVGPDFLGPLLLGPGRRAVSTVMAPIPLERATRQARSARAADVADEELRSRAGFLPSARRDREASGVVRREMELSDGHSEYRYSGFVTVTAPDRQALEAVCGQAEQSAQEAHVELRRLYGRQAEAYWWTQPLGRGLAGR